MLRPEHTVAETLARFEQASNNHTYSYNIFKTYRISQIGSGSGTDDSSKRQKHLK
jgi:hypothetical protein